MSALQKSKPKVIFIIGCTASGKAALAHHLAVALHAEILSIDSMKVYREMDVGTAKPSPAARDEVPYHLIDVVDPSESFSAARFVDLAENAIADVHHRGRTTVAAGGTAMYLKALTEGLFDGPGSDAQLRNILQRQAEQNGAEHLHQRLQELDPQAAQRIHHNDLKRIIRALEVFELTGRPISELQEQFGTLRDDYSMHFIGIRHQRDPLNRRINARVKRMIEQGLVDEVRRLYHRTPPLSEQAAQALGYAEIIQHLAGTWDLETAVEKIKINTRRFAKSQRTWFRRMRHIQWLDVPEHDEPLSLIEQVKTQINAWLDSAH